MLKGIDTIKKAEKAVLVSVFSDNRQLALAEEHLDELALLAQTAGAVVIKKFMQRLEIPNPRTYLGQGKLAEVEAFVKQYEADLLIVDDELSPAQLRNLNKQFPCKILDRSNLILDIFATHARSAQARYQVELAQLQYLLPRLTRMWTHLTRHAGGIGTRGPGETEMETDKRAIRNKMLKLKERLSEIEKQALTRRKNRSEKIRISLVGYTNAGKSTILNLLCKSDVLAEDKLFATLDSTVRKLEIDGTGVLLSDTVGFIRKLPHPLIECFKSTLDEVREADILIHVADISHPSSEEQIQTVMRTLDELGVSGKPILTIFNKTDLIEYSADEFSPDLSKEDYILSLAQSWMAKEKDPVLFVSAIDTKSTKKIRASIASILDDWRQRPKDH